MIIRPYEEDVYQKRSVGIKGRELIISWKKQNKQKKSWDKAAETGVDSWVIVLLRDKMQAFAWDHAPSIYHIPE